MDTVLVKNNRDEVIEGDFHHVGAVYIDDGSFRPEVVQHSMPTLDTGSAAAMLPVYDSEGELVGYVQIFEPA
jgi:hypothetical protein